MKAGVKATRQNATNALIAFHLESLGIGQFDTTMNMLKSYNIDYDVMGASYYPFWGVDKNTLANVQKMVNDKYGKLFSIMETAWINSDKDVFTCPWCCKHRGYFYIHLNPDKFLLMK